MLFRSVVGNTGLVHELLLKIGARVMIVRNIEVGDMLANGQIGVLREVIKVDGVPDVLVVALRDKSAGKANRQNHTRLASTYPNCVFIEKVKVDYSLRQRSGDVGSTATVFQFPIRVAFGTTAHKVQGQSIPYPTTVQIGRAHV